MPGLFTPFGLPPPFQIGGLVGIETLQLSMWLLWDGIALAAIEHHHNTNDNNNNNDDNNNKGWKGLIVLAGGRRRLLLLVA